MSERRTLRATDVVGARVEDADGRRIGSVIDLALAPRDPTAITHLLVGGSTFLGRFSVLRGERSPLGRFGAELALRIEEVERIEPGRVVASRRAAAATEGRDRPNADMTEEERDANP